MTRAVRSTIAVGAFAAVFLGCLLLLARGVGIPAKVLVAVPLVVVGIAGGLAAARPHDGWTSGAAPPVHAARARSSVAAEVWYLLPFLPVGVVVIVFLAADGDLFGPMKGALLISTAVLVVAVVVTLARLRPQPTAAAGRPAVRPERAALGSTQVTRLR